MNNDLLIQFLESLKTDVINSMQAKGRGATGQTARQIIIADNGGNVQLQLPGYMQLLETGRRPTGSNPIAGDPPMIQRIRQWCRAKGIPDKAAWAIKKSIDKKGFKGVPGILTEPLGDGNINSRLKPVLDEIADSISEQLIKLIR